MSQNQTGIEPELSQNRPESSGGTTYVSPKEMIEEELFELLADLEDLNDEELADCRAIMLVRVSKCLSLIARIPT